MKKVSVWKIRYRVESKTTGVLGEKEVDARNVVRQMFPLGNVEIISCRKQHVLEMPATAYREWKIECAKFEKIFGNGNLETKDG